MLTVRSAVMPPHVPISGGGWGVGDGDGAVDTGLAVPSVRVEGVTDQISDPMAAADALMRG